MADTIYITEHGTEMAYSRSRRRLDILSYHASPYKQLRAFLQERTDLEHGILVKIPSTLQEAPPEGFACASSGVAVWLYMPPIHPLCPHPRPVSYRPIASVPLRALSAPVRAALAVGCELGVQLSETMLSISVFESHMSFKFTPKVSRLLAPATPNVSDRRLLLRTRHLELPHILVAGMSRFQYDYTLDGDYETFDAGCTALVLSQGSISREKLAEPQAATLWDALATAVTVGNHAARIIQRAWRRAIACPEYNVCVRRLRREASADSFFHPPQ